MKFNMGLNSPVLFDRLAYTYLPNSNKLQKVVDTVSAYYNRGEFKNGTAQGYDYDESGNLTKDLSKDISKITYTWFNKPQTITYSNGNSIEYVYDAGGNKLRESITEGGTNKKLDYQGGAYLEKGELQFVNTPAGRTNLKNPGEKEEFFIKDHLGNVRAIIADVEPPVVIIGPGGLRYAAGYEAQDAITEEQFFNSISAISEPKPNSTSSNDVKAALLDSAQMVGTSILLKVMAGDRLKINADNFYNELSSAPEDANGIETAMGQVLGSLSVGADGNTSSESPSVSELLGNSVDPASLQTAYDALQASGMDSTKPRSFLNYLFFDENMKLIPEQSHLWQADGEANWSQVGTDAQEDIEARQSGYVVVYLSNQSNAPVYFDNLVVTMEPGALLEERHYYPYGLPIQGWGSSAAGSLTNRQRYQSNEYREEAGLNWMDFHNRQYDPQIGRFLGIDPLADDVGQRTLSPYLAMGANPACNVDPLGLQFNPVQDMPRGGGLSSPGVAFVDGGWVVMGAWAMAFGKNSSMQAIIDVLSNADNNRGNANAEKAVAEFQVIALGASKGQRGNVGSNSVSSTATGPDGADASKDGGGSGVKVNGIEVQDFPTSGYAFEGNVAYDLKSFNNFFIQNKKKYKAKELRGDDGEIIKIENISDIKLDDKPSTLYSEVGSFLRKTVHRFGTIIISFGENTDPSKSGTMNNFNLGNQSTYYIPANRTDATIHLHQGTGNVLSFKESNIFLRSGMVNLGPSNPGDYPSPSQPYRNEVIDNKYIYLINSNPSQNLIYKRPQ